MRHKLIENKLIAESEEQIFLYAKEIKNNRIPSLTVQTYRQNIIRKLETSKLTDLTKIDFSLNYFLIKS